MSMRRARWETRATLWLVEWQDEDPVWYGVYFWFIYIYITHERGPMRRTWFYHCEKKSFMSMGRMRAFCFNFWSRISPTHRLNDKLRYARDVAEESFSPSAVWWRDLLFLRLRWARSWQLILFLVTSRFWDDPENAIIFFKILGWPRHLKNGDKYWFCGIGEYVVKKW